MGQTKSGFSGIISPPSDTGAFDTAFKAVTGFDVGGVPLLSDAKDIASAIAKAATLASTVSSPIQAGFSGITSAGTGVANSSGGLSQAFSGITSAGKGFDVGFGRDRVDPGKSNLFKSVLSTLLDLKGDDDSESGKAGSILKDLVKDNKSTEKGSKDLPSLPEPPPTPAPLNIPESALLQSIISRSLGPADIFGTPIDQRIARRF